MKQIPEGTKFQHYRFVDSEGKIQSRGGVTFAYRVDPAAGTVVHATAKCHTMDNFNKRIARIKSAGRTLSKRAMIYKGTEAQFVEELESGLAGVNEVYEAVLGLQLQRSYSGRRKGGVEG